MTVLCILIEQAIIEYAGYNMKHKIISAIYKLYS